MNTVLDPSPMPSPQPSPVGGRGSKSGRGRKAAVAFAAVALLLALLRLWPHAPLSETVGSSRAVYAQGGELLRLTLASDEQYRLWVPLERISPTLSLIHI